ncbi:uncharacterized protein [Lolium perenne]|uniref:uncharacterized protein n=1 Tax=Lolium perenne TaxID=4522 RepID=UPI0021F559C9|nr:uncharacterized protein LOC127323202 [Lolium perenne]
MAVARVSAGGSVVPALLVVLLVCAAAVVAGGTACDGVSCGVGTCRELPATPVPVPQSMAYVCDCEAGWARIVPALLFTPCFIPTCKSDLSCYSPTFKLPPFGSNVTLHPCLVMDCGREGTCVEEQGKPFHCQCNPGATNMLNNPSLPCTKNCAIGKDGCPVPNPPPPPPPPPPPASLTAPPDNGTDSSTSSSSKGSPTVPASPGSACLQSLLLLLASLAALYIV